MFLIATLEGGNPVWEFFANNLFNWLLLVVFLVWLWLRIMPGLFAQRKDNIESALGDAARAKAEGQSFLQTQQNKITNAEKEAEKILVEARQVAEQMKVELKAQTERELADLRVKVDQQIASERRLAITQLRTATAKVAIQLTEAVLPQVVSANTRTKLLSQFLEQVEATSEKS